MYRFDADTHTYWNDDERIPSVSEIIPAPEFFVSEERLEECRLEGEDMHSRIKLYHDTSETWGDPLLVAMEKWERENKDTLGKLIAYERPLYCTHYGGTPDMVFERGIVDFKRQFGNSRSHALQLVAYHHLALSELTKKYDGGKLWIITFDGTEIKDRDVGKYGEAASEVFKELVIAWWARRKYEKYMSNELNSRRSHGRKHA